MKCLMCAAIAFALIGTGAATAAEVETERMTWIEIRNAVAEGKSTIIIPTGGTEQNGPHMVTGKHNFIVKETAKRIAVKLGDALVAPVMAYVPEGDIAKREGHMAYAGTISVPPEIFARVLAAAAESFVAHGFKTVVFLGDSGPNQEPQRLMAAELSKHWAEQGVRVMNATAYYANNGGVDLLKSEGETPASIGNHASIADTSELLAVAPDGVRLDRRALDQDGVVGDPTRATAERGEKLLTLKVAAAVKEIEAARQAPIETAAPPSEDGPKNDDGILSRLWRWAFG